MKWLKEYLFTTVLVPYLSKLIQTFPKKKFIQNVSVLVIYTNYGVVFGTFVIYNTNKELFISAQI